MAKFIYREILEEDENSLPSLIYKAYEDAAKKFDGYGIAIGQANVACDRAIWYSFRWVTEPENIEGRILRLFETGNIEEDRIVKDLIAAGVAITGQQDKMRLIGGHLRGKIDGFAENVPEARKTRHLAEFKSMNKKWMDKLKSVRRIKHVKPEYYGQCQLGMHAFGLDRCLFVATCKDDDRYHVERIKYDIDFATTLLARLKSIVERPNPPGGICKASTDSHGRFCKHRAVCWEDAPVRKHCRTCLHASPEMDGDARWVCSRHAVDLSFDDQPKGCPAHLFIPSLVPAEYISMDKQAETVTYRLPSGALWVNRAGEE